MDIIITGAGGFIGKNLLLALAGRNRVLALDRDGSLSKFVAKYSLPNVRVAACDLNDGAALRREAGEWGEEPDAVIYLAGNGDPAYSVEHPGEDLRDTVAGLVNFFSCFRTRRAIYFSSGAVYDGISGPVSPETRLDPRLPYSIGKMACEQYVKFFQKNGRIGDYLIFRFFGAYGPHEPPRKIYTKLVRALCLEKKKEFTIRGDGNNLIDAMFVDDTVRAVETALTGEAADRTLDLCVGEPLTLKELVEEAGRVFGIEVKVVCQGEVPEYIDFRPSAAAMEEIYGFTPRVPLSEGLPALARYLEEVGDG